MREGKIERETKETRVRVEVNLDGSGTCSIQTGVPFFDHMLTSMGKHGGFDLTVAGSGEPEGDHHHLIEDVGIVLGTALKKAYGEGKGIRRFAHALVPMDESCAQVALDVGGRGYLVFQGNFGGPQVGGIPRDVIEHFFYSLCINAGVTCHISFTGTNDHHQSEAVFKAFGIALGDAVTENPRKKGVPSTKGVL
ncbi:MAG: imidazoleglycerol-phosphate dehydratase HisB [Methanomicrobiales archaeon]|nr:imidazoleglycerol-phosphate dehydratase HisB [Methanomicrobiales archaeon]